MLCLSVNNHAASCPAAHQANSSAVCSGSSVGACTWHHFNLNSMPLPVKQHNNAMLPMNILLFMHSHLIECHGDDEHHVHPRSCSMILGGAEVDRVCSEGCKRRITLAPVITFDLAARYRQNASNSVRWVGRVAASINNMS